MKEEKSGAFIGQLIEQWENGGFHSYPSVAVSNHLDLHWEKITLVMAGNPLDIYGYNDFSDKLKPPTDEEKLAMAHLYRTYQSGIQLMDNGQSYLAAEIVPVLRDLQERCNIALMHLALSHTYIPVNIANNLSRENALFHTDKIVKHGFLLLPRAGITYLSQTKTDFSYENIAEHLIRKMVASGPYKKPQKEVWRLIK